jgi:hypothetical protein
MHSSYRIASALHQVSTFDAAVGQWIAFMAGEQIQGLVMQDLQGGKAALLRRRDRLNILTVNGNWLHEFILMTWWRLLKISTQVNFLYEEVWSR